MTHTLEEINDTCKRIVSEQFVQPILDKYGPGVIAWHLHHELDNSDIVETVCEALPLVERDTVCAFVYASMLEAIAEYFTAICPSSWVEEEDIANHTRDKFLEACKTVELN